MSEMLEKVARALCISRHGGFPVDREARLRDSDNWKGSWWWQAEQDARAALLALREPTEGMVEAMNAANRDAKSDNGQELGFAGIFTAAIDHALQTQGEGE